MPPVDYVEAHRRLLEADMAYANQQSSEHNLAVVRAQRVYYAALSHHLKATLPVSEARTRRAQQLTYRARWNRKRQQDDAAWQSLALHQIQRTTRIRMRCEALALVEQWNMPTTQPEPILLTKPKKPKRVRHPITRRYVDDDR